MGVKDAAVSVGGVDEDARRIGGEGGRCCDQDEERSFHFFSFFHAINAFSTEAFSFV